MAQHFLSAEGRKLLTESSVSRLSHRNEGEIMIFSNEAKLKVFVARKPTHKEWLLDVLQTEMK